MGQGYVGLPVAMRAVACGYSVVGFDVDEARVKRLNAGESYVEDVPDAVLQEALATGRYRATTAERDCAGFDVAVITVPTPLRDGVPDLSYIEASARTLGRYLRPGATVVLESTTYPGTTEELVKPILEEMSGLLAGPDFHLGYSPERIDPGNPTWGFVNTPEGRLRHRRRLAGRGRRLLRLARRPHRARRRPQGSRADQAAGEHLPARQHRPGQRAGHVRRRPRHRRLGGHRRRQHQAVRLHALHPRARRRRPLPARSTRRTCPGGCAARSATRSGSSSWPTTSTTTCPTTWCAA